MHCAAQGTSGASGYGGYGQQSYTANQAADTNSTFGGNMGTTSYGNDASGYGTSGYGQVNLSDLQGH